MSAPAFSLIGVGVAVASFYSLGWSLSLGRRVRRLERHSRLDPLTGLGSGDWLENERWPAALRSGRPLGVAYLDLDHLKRTNDVHGHDAGDKYIRVAADTLRSTMRRGVDEVFRCHRAGDEFEVLLHGPITDLNRCAWSLLRRLSEQGVSASLGLAYTTATEFVPARSELRAAAEAACRDAKKRGGGCGMVAGRGLVVAPPNGEPHLAEAPASRAAERKAYGDRLRRKREAIGWTRRDLGTACKVSHALIRSVELGRMRLNLEAAALIEARLDAELAKRGSGGKKP